MALRLVLILLIDYCCLLVCISSMALSLQTLQASLRPVLLRTQQSFSLSSARATPRHFPLLSVSRLRFVLSVSTTSLDDAQYTKSYRIQGVGRQSQAEMTTNTGHVIQTDVPKKMGGKDVAPQPVETLLAALLGCTQATAVFVGRHMEPRVLIDRLEFDVSATRDDRGALELPISNDPAIPSRLQHITGTIRVYTKGNKNTCLTNEQLKLLSHQTELRCPIANMMIASGCQMDIAWLDGASSSDNDE